MKQRLISLTLALAVILCVSVPALAAVQSTVAIPTLSFNGTTANCNVRILASGLYIDATLSLYCGGTLIDSWSDSRYHRVDLSGTASVVSGNTYTLTVSGTAGGTPISSTPVTKTCP